MVVDVQAFLYCMNHFTISGSSCEPSKKGLSVSSVFIRAMSSADRVKSNMSRFCFMRSGFTDLGIIMHTDIYRARTVFGAEDDGMQFQPDGYLLMFHPDLLRNTPLGRIMREYSFFSYETNEALHLSVEERQIIMDCFHKIQYELNHPIHRHSKNLITDSIKTFLDYCTRFYDRQFITRDNQNRDILARFERLLDEYFHDGAAKRIGLPTVQYCADKLCLSPNYFSDLLKKETGSTALHFIHDKSIEIAKTELASTDDTVNEIAYNLGFQYPQHFTRLFKKEVGYTPNEYRAQVS